MVLQVEDYKKEAKSVYLLADSVNIDRSGDFSCPVKSVAIFVHNRDISYSSIEAEVLRLMNDCTTIDDVHRLARVNSDIIPPISSSSLGNPTSS